MFRLAVNLGRQARRQHATAIEHVPYLFGREMTFAQLSSLVERGARFEVEKLTETPRHRQVLRPSGEKAAPPIGAPGTRTAPLICIGSSGRPRIASADAPLSPRKGDHVIRLVMPGGDIT